MNTPGHYIQPALAPYLHSRRILATKLKDLPDGRVLLRDDTVSSGRYYIETEADSFEPSPCRADITLSTGTIITHTREENGSQLASVVGGGEMTKVEWEEYVMVVLKEKGAR